MKKYNNKGHHDHHTDAARTRAVALSQACTLPRLRAATPLPLVSVVVVVLLPLPVVELPATVATAFVVAGGVVDTLVSVGVVVAGAGVVGTCAGVPVVVAGPVVPVVPKEGAAIAVLGSTRAPTPHGIGSLEPGCVALAGGVVAPDVGAIVKRPVHVVLGLWGAVNW